MFQIPSKAKKEKSIIKMTKAETLTWLVYLSPASRTTGTAFTAAVASL